jgi:ankyrin repeat protein
MVNNNKRFLGTQAQVIIQRDTKRQKLSNDSAATKKDKPVAYLLSLLPSKFGEVKRAYFDHKVNIEERMDAYDNASVSAIRSKDVASLRNMHKEGKSFDGCNRQGETLLHLACRRGDVETIEFLIREAGVCTDVCDSLGRTVFHDACWRPEPDFAVMDCLIRTVSPEHLVAKDVRGHAPFDYTRQEHREAWNGFIDQSKELLLSRVALVAVGEPLVAVG